MSVEAKNTLLFADTNLLKSHETILADDFKGVTNTGPKLHNKDSIGMLNVLKFYNKIYLTNTSLSENSDLVKTGQFIPFIHFNFLYHYGDEQKKFNTRKKIEADSKLNVIHINESQCEEIHLNNKKDKNDTNLEIENSKLYFSAGFGVTFLSEFIALEAYYNAIVKKNKYDIGTEFGFNIGID